MRNALLAALMVLTLFLTVTGPAASQAVSAAYEGPRYPGGPDSLRAYLRRHTIPKAGAEPVFVQFDVVPSAPFKNLQVLTPPGRRTPKPAITAATLAAAKAMPAWIPGRQDVETPITTVTLGFNQGSNKGLAYPYADEMPVFADMAPGIIGLYRYLPTVLVMPELGVLRKNAMNDVYAYFEVAETGRLENRQIIGGNLPALNQAAMLTLHKLPDATTPAKLNGRPVRIYYVLSIGFNVE